MKLNHHRSTDILHDGCLSPRAYYIPYRTTDSVSPFEAASSNADCELSSRFTSLCGNWSFMLFSSPEEVPEEAVGYDFPLPKESISGRKAHSQR